jgi:hypothetical protein
MYAMSNKTVLPAVRISVHRTVHAALYFDPELAELRAALTALGAVLATYGASLLLEHAAHQQVDLVVTAVVLAATLARTQRGADPADRLIALVVLAAAAATASEVGSLLILHPAIGDTVFTAAVAATIWIRRFGRRASLVGTVAVIPFVALLVTHAQGVPPYGADHDAWSALVGVFAACLVPLFQWAAAEAGFSPADRRRPNAPQPEETGQPQQEAPPGRRRIAANVRMAAQMGAALALAFVAGHLWFTDHWPWVVLTAFIVCSGARGRADVLYKGVQRALGAAIGTIVATAIAGSFPADDVRSIVIIFAVLGIAIWLRQASYTYWAGCVTAMLSLLYGYFGESAPPLLHTRLEEIALGAVIGIAASWLVMPVRTDDVLRRRIADALAALSRILTSGPDDELPTRQLRFAERVRQLELIAKPLAAQRILAQARIPVLGNRRPADALDAVRSLAAPVRDLVAVLQAEPCLTADPGFVRLRSAVTANAGAVRRAIGRRPGSPYRHLPPPRKRTPGQQPVAAGLVRAAAALRAVDDALAGLDEIYPAPPPPEVPEPAAAEVPEPAA